MSLFHTLLGIFALSLLGFMAVAFLAILIVKLHDKKPKPMMAERSRVAFWLSALGLPAFLLGLALPFLPGLVESTHHGDALLFALLGGGFLAISLSIFLNAMLAKSKRKSWPVVPAQCTHQQLEGGPNGWLWRAVCEIDYGGKQYAVSPKVRWSDLAQADAPFWKEEKARWFISRKISPKGECRLRINPDDPFEAELL
jgi:hypothetical protein